MRPGVNRVKHGVCLVLTGSFIVMELVGWRWMAHGFVIGSRETGTKT